MMLHIPEVLTPAQVAEIRQRLDAADWVDGKATVPVYPHLAGQNSAYLLKQMKAFKEGSRTEPLMAPFMAMLNEADMENLAAYYASLK